MADLVRKILSSNRRAERRGVVVDFTVEEWQLLLDFYHNCCAYCGEGAELTQDHVVPLSKGGSHTKDNIVPACKPCNGLKGSRDLDDFLRLRQGG